MSGNWPRTQDDLVNPTGSYTTGSSGSTPGSSTSGLSGAANAGSSSGSGGVMGQAQDMVTNVQQKASDLGGQATTKADAGMEKAAGGLETIASAIRDKSDVMGEGTAQSVAATAADKIQSGADMLRSTDTDQLMTELESLIRRKPVESMLVAAGIGFLLARGMR